MARGVKKTLKVWGGMMMVGGDQRRVIMAGTVKAFRAATELTRDFMSDTGNPAELVIAMNEPGVLFCALDRRGNYFCPVSEIRHHQ